MKKNLLNGALVILLCSIAMAQQYKVLYSFAGAPTDGRDPSGSLVADRAGNLYGVTTIGGSSAYCEAGCGTVFELSPHSNGTWSETVLYDFCTGNNKLCPDGELPMTNAGGLVLDSKGNLYGVTDSGGTCAFGRLDCGIVYELSPSSGGKWTYSLLYAFCQNPNDRYCSDGIAPNGPLVIDATGNLYGTTGGGGVNLEGSVFELSQGSGGWTKTIIYSFCRVRQGFGCADGAQPLAGLTFDKSGNLYGTTSIGGPTKSQYGGTIFKLSHGSNGWTEKVLIAFQTNNGQGENPNLDLGGINIDPEGNLYTTFLQYSGFTDGGVIRLTPKGRADIVPMDNGQGLDGSEPNTGLVLDLNRRVLYGTTQGGNENNGGVVFQFNPAGQETVLYDFCSQPNCSDGWIPYGGLLEDKTGNLYGTTSRGGSAGNGGNGVVFEITP